MAEVCATEIIEEKKCHFYYLSNVSKPSAMRFRFFFAFFINLVSNVAWAKEFNKVLRRVEREEENG